MTETPFQVEKSTRLPSLRSQDYLILLRGAGCKNFTSLRLHVAEVKFQVSAAKKLGVGFFYLTPTHRANALLGCGMLGILGPWLFSKRLICRTETSCLNRQAEKTRCYDPPSNALLLEQPFQKKQATIPAPTVQSHDSESLHRSRDRPLNRQPWSSLQGN